MSQPTRAVVWFLAHHSLEYEFKLIAVTKLQQFTPEYKKMY
eukprot:gene21131-25385_t